MNESRVVVGDGCQVRSDINGIEALLICEPLCVNLAMAMLPETLPGNAFPKLSAGPKVS